MAETRPTPGIPSVLRPTLPPWAEITAERLHHVQRVAELLSQWADAMGIPDPERNRWLKAVWLHDAHQDARVEELMRWAPSAPGPVELRHGPASAARAKAEGETDRGVLDAVRYHSVGLAEWDLVGRSLYCADFLEPGRAFEPEERRALAERFPTESRAAPSVLERARRLRAVALIGLAGLGAFAGAWSLLGRRAPEEPRTPSAV